MGVRQRLSDGNAEHPSRDNVAEAGTKRDIRTESSCPQYKAAWILRECSRYLEDVVRMVLTVRIGGHYSNAIWPSAQYVIYAGFQGGAFAEVDGVTQDGGLGAESVHIGEQGRVTSTAAIVNDNDNGDPGARKPLNQLEQSCGWPKCRYQSGNL